MPADSLSSYMNVNAIVWVACSCLLTFSSIPCASFFLFFVFCVSLKICYSVMKIQLCCKHFYNMFYLNIWIFFFLHFWRFIGLRSSSEEISILLIPLNLDIPEYFRLRCSLLLLLIRLCCCRVKWTILFCGPIL